MGKSTGLIRKGLLVTLTLMIVVVVAYFLYFALFMIFERTFQGNYGFAPKLRAGYGIAWFLGALLLDQTKFPEWLKAGVFSGSMAVFMIAMGVILYENPTLKVIVILLTFVLSIIYLVYRKKESFYYYGVFIALSAAGFYLWR